MIEVILRENVPSLGKTGDLVRVKPGYARNFLLPRGLAFEASEGNKKRIEGEQRARTSRLAHEKADAEALASRLAAASVRVSGKAGEEGKLFGSVTSQDIADALERQGLAIDKRRIELEHPIKALGHHTVSVRLHPEVHAEVKVVVVAE
ncbi:MAG: 50S ribosomal protein L9 [Gemmatimonadales bacterium]|jgi:large subunit ribosomal protein L9|nr:50S ribosomal protein L9 [Gemmatimonadales bacterium]